MKKDFSTLPDFANLARELSASPNPFQERAYQNFLSRLQKAQSEDAHYASLLSELEKLAERLSLLIRKAEEMEPKLQELLDKISKLRSVIWEKDDFLDHLDDEIAKLTRTLAKQPENPDRADEIIRQATVLLIRGKNFKRSKLEADLHRANSLYEKRGREYLALLGQFREACQSVKDGKSASAEVIRMSGEAFSKKHGVVESEMKVFKAENVIPELVETQAESNFSVEEDFPGISASRETPEFPEPSNGKINHRLELDEHLSFDVNGDTDPHPMQAYNKVTLQGFIKEIEQEEQEIVERKKQTGLQKEKKSTHVTGNSFQQEFLLNSIPKTNLKNNRGKKRPQK